MTRPKLSLGIVVFFGLLLGAAARAEEVTLSYQGLTLNADLERAAGRTLADNVFLIVHGTQSHNGMELIARLQSLLKDRGYNSLAINLSLGLDNRHGFYDCSQPSTHRHADAVGEIGAWMKWLGDRGARSVVLLGHSRGGNQIAIYAAERDNPLLRALVMMAPASFTQDEEAQGYQDRFGRPLAPLLARAESLVKAGQGKTLLEHVPFLLRCRDTSVTAESFVSYYGPDPRRYTPSLMPKIRKPALLVVAGNDELVKNLDKKFAPTIDGKRLRMKIIEGSDHFFKDLYADDAVDEIVAFLGSRQP